MPASSTPAASPPPTSRPTAKAQAPHSREASDPRSSGAWGERASRRAAPRQAQPPRGAATRAAAERGGLRSMPPVVLLAVDVAARAVLGMLHAHRFFRGHLAVALDTGLDVGDVLLLVFQKARRNQRISFDAGPIRNRPMASRLRCGRAGSKRIRPRCMTPSDAVRITARAGRVSPEASVTTAPAEAHDTSVTGAFKRMRVPSASVAATAS